MLNKLKTLVQEASKSRLFLNMLGAFVAPIGIALAADANLRTGVKAGCAAAIAAFVAFIQHPQSKTDV